MFRSHQGKKRIKKNKHTLHISAHVIPYLYPQECQFAILACNVSHTMRHCKCKPVQASFGSCFSTSKIAKYNGARSLLIGRVLDHIPSQLITGNWETQRPTSAGVSWYFANNSAKFTHFFSYALRRTGNQESDQL